MQLEIPTTLLVEFLKKKGFALMPSDPFSHTYVRGKIAISIDNGAPTVDVGFQKEDLLKQKHLERAVTDKLFDDLVAYTEDCARVSIEGQP